MINIENGLEIICGMVPIKTWELEYSRRMGPILRGYIGQTMGFSFSFPVQSTILSTLSVSGPKMLHLMPTLASYGNTYSSTKTNLLPTTPLSAGTLTAMYFGIRKDGIGITPMLFRNWHKSAWLVTTTIIMAWNTVRKICRQCTY